MKEKALKNLDRLDQATEALFLELSVYSDEQLNRRPGPGRWSALMTLHHLILAEGYSHLYVIKKLKGDGPFKVGTLTDYWRLFLIWAVFASLIKRKAPKGVGDESIPETDQLENVQAKWREQRQKLRDHLTSLPDHLFNKAIYKQPFVGRLTFPGMMRFFYLHFAHHRKQVRRAVALN